MKKADENDIRCRAKWRSLSPSVYDLTYVSWRRAEPRHCQRQLYRTSDHHRFVREALRDLLALQEKLVTIAIFRRRWRSTTRSKSRISFPASIPLGGPSAPDGDGAGERATNHSLPEIGDAFGGRDHTTGFMPAGRSSSCVKRATISKKFF